MRPFVPACGGEFAFDCGTFWPFAVPSLSVCVLDVLSSRRFLPLLMAAVVAANPGYVSHLYQFLFSPQIVRSNSAKYEKFAEFAEKCKRFNSNYNVSWPNIG